MLPTSVYDNSRFSSVVDKVDFYKGKFQEVKKIKSMVDKAKLLLTLPEDRITIDVAQGERIYRVKFHGDDVNKIIFGYFIFIPELKRIDFWDQGGLVLQYYNKKCVYSNCSALLTRAGIAERFKPIVLAS
jgi:hypothetical protein